MKTVKTTSENGRRVDFTVDHDIGSVGLYYIEPRSPNNPSDRPWHLISWGTTHETPEAGLEHAIRTWDAPSDIVEDRRYERAEASFGERE